MKRAIYLLLVAVAVTSLSAFSAGAQRSDAGFLEGSVKIIAAQFTSLTVAPLDQTREITDTAQLRVTLTGTGCVFQVFFVPTLAPETLAAACPQVNGEFVGEVPISSSLPPTRLNPITLPGAFDVVSGIHQGSVHVPLAFTVDPAAFANRPLGQAFSFQVQAAANYIDFDHRVGSDTGQATALVSPICYLGYFDLSGVSGGLDIPLGCDASAAKDLGLTPVPLTSNQADVRWIKTGGIDTSIFVRRTPVVEQAAAPAAPAVQAPSTGTGRITAPNTGDAGLQATGNSSSDVALPLGISLALAGACGAFVLHRRRRAT